ncbi:alkaline phosphatase D family protein [Sandarakinorhabdus rubra]|uniref:alkaline phosphatase D family protein n=1 Tax=Sandarakinorhabdus rubra TaxID=2672568 RepID=UPI0013DC05F2|nr:alkaline phosphatase D family protein [Sandarakinorhabdus rubra]
MATGGKLVSNIARRDVLAGLAGTALLPAAAQAGSFPTLAGLLDVPVSPTLDPELRLTRIGIGSCFNQNRDGSLLDVALRSRPDLFLFMGDNVYGDTRSPDLNELIGAYAAALARPDYRRFRAAMPMVAVWDDHDFGLNDAGVTYAWKAATRPLFFDFWNVPADAPRRQGSGINDAFITGPKGARVQVILLDTRSFRDDWTPSPTRGQPGAESYVENPDPSRTILGEAQWQWLEAQLRQPADVRIIVTSYQLVADGHGYECWRLFPHERARFRALVSRTRANGIVLVSGDRHRAGIYRDATGVPYPLHELTSSSINMGWAGEHREEAGPNRIGPSYSANNVGLIRLDWERREIGLDILDAGDRVVLSQGIAMDALRI